MRKTKYSGHRLSGVRNFTKPNFGLGSRQIDKCLINASLEQLGGVKNNTHLARLPACRAFSAFLKENTDIKRLKQIEKTHVLQFGEHLRERFESESTFSSASARDYLSHVNVCLAQARGDEAVKVLATKELDYPSKTGIATVDGSTSSAEHHYIVSNASEPVAVLAQLQRAFGLRMREASLLDCNKALEQMQVNAEIVIERGTKGGQPRNVPCDTTSQRKALERGAKLQYQTGHDNLTPTSMSFKAFQTAVWREHQSIDCGYRTHGERKHYACEYYKQHMGALPPVKAQVEHGKAHHRYLAEALNISVTDATKRDKEVRLALSKLLGHHRLSISNAYVG
ncbi:integrase domain-containing protein [Vibrio comitans]|uniref:integrase domain-containing protein n=1 Tax=Vibrio comitans TaxID=413401 RepID=UPI003081526D